MILLKKLKGEETQKVKKCILICYLLSYLKEYFVKNGYKLVKTIKKKSIIQYKI